jgi:VWFA-related protein
MIQRHALGLALVLLLRAAAAGAQEYGETLDVNVVTVDVEVRDSQGRQVTDLDRGDFELFEDGKRVKLANFERVSRAGSPTTTAAAAAPPVMPPAASPEASAPPPAESTHLVVYVDNAHLHGGNRARVLQQLRDVLAGEGAGARVMIVSQGLGPLRVELPFASDPAAIAAALDRVGTLAVHGQDDDHTRSTVVEAVVAIQRQNLVLGSPCAANIADPVNAYATNARQAVRSTLGQLGRLVSSLAGLPGRKALVYVSDGISLQPGADLFEVLRQICGGGAATSGLGYTTQLPGGGSRARPAPPPDNGFGIPMLDVTTLGTAAYRPQSAALDAAGYDMTEELHKLTVRASANRVALYTLQASGLGAGAPADVARVGPEGLLQIPAVADLAVDNAKQSLVYLAHETGGRAILDANDVRPDLGRLREDLRAFYSLGFTPDHQGDGKEHRVEVRLKRPGLRLTYPRSYRDKPALEQVADRTLAALLHGFEDNPLEVRIELLPAEPLPNGHFQVTARLLVPLFKLATLTLDDVYEAKLRVVAAAGTAGGESTGLRQVEVPVRVPRQQALTAFGQSYAYEVRLELAAGEHTLAFAVRDELGGTASFLRRTVEVKPPVAASAVAP